VVRTGRRACALALGAVIVAGVRKAAAQQVEVGRNVQVSAALPHEPHFETIVAADPAHPDRLIACSMLLPVERAQSAETVTYVSFDGGRTWELTLRVRGDRDQESWDPDCAYGPDGTAYSISEGIDSLQAAYVRIDRSIDGGRTWGSPRRVPHFERTFLTVDRTAGPRRGWLYLHGQGGAPTMGGGDGRSYVGGVGLHVLSPSGEMKTHTLLSRDDSFVINVGPGVVLSDGTFVGVFAEIQHYWDPNSQGRIPPNTPGWPRRDAKANAWLKVVRLGPEDRSPSAVTISDFFSAWGEPELLSSSTIPSLAADTTRGPFRDRLYAVWPDLRSGRVEVLLSTSPDSGKTWTAPRVVNDDRPRRAPAGGPNHLHPVVAVNGAGVIGVAWYDRRERPDELGWDVRFSASLDGGETFLPSVKVSEHPNSPGAPRRWHLEAFTRPATDKAPAITTIGLHFFNVIGGDTGGHTADAKGSFHPLWVSNATGTAQLWTAPVRVEGAAVEHGDSTLSRLTDVSRAVQLEYTNRMYDAEKRLVEVDVALRNQSQDTVTGPISVRLIDIGSEFGVLRLLDADNGRPGSGAIWRFSDEIDGGTLRPGQVSRSRRVRFGVKDVGPLLRLLDPFLGLVVVSSRVFATAVTGPAARDSETSSTEEP
jgi:hypothetical protein